MSISRNPMSLGHAVAWLFLGLFALASPAFAALFTLDSVKTGAFFIDNVGGFVTPDYVTGIQYAFGAETRGLVAFDVTSLPDGAIQSATLSLQNPYSANEPGGALELRLYGLPYMSWANYTGNTYINQSNFTYIGSAATPQWGTAFVNPVVWPGSTVTFDLPDAALTALRQAADGPGPYHGDFFAFGLRIVKADVEEPKPLQYVFGGTATGGNVQLAIDVTPVPLPGSWTMMLAGLVLTGLAARRCGRQISLHRLWN